MCVDSPYGGCWWALSECQSLRKVRWCIVMGWTPDSLVRWVCHPCHRVGSSRVLCVVVGVVSSHGGRMALLVWVVVKVGDAL